MDILKLGQVVAPVFCQHRSCGSEFFLSALCTCHIRLKLGLEEFLSNKYIKLNISIKCIKIREAD